MGCISSSNKLHELRQDNVFRVRVAHLPGTPIIRSGYLELNPRELIFLTPGCEPIVWALQHLRRYGLNADLFSFEAGRRCMSGPGIYTFRVHNADLLYPMFQRYINAINTDAFAQVERERVNSTHSVLLGRTDANPHSNNYLEPAPLLGRAGNANMPTDALQAAEFNAVPQDAPDPLPITQMMNGGEMTPGAYINTNVYFDQPLRALQEHNNNSSSNALDGATAQSNTPPLTATTTTTMFSSNGSYSAFSTMRRRTLLKGCSLDMPPQESAPALMDSLHMYANVDTPSSCSLRERLLFDLSSGGGSERCYENVNRLDLPLLLQPTPKRESSQQSVASTSTTQQQPTTPTSSVGDGGASISGVNYIVLDLDQPRSPVQSSPKTLNNDFGSGLSLMASAAALTASAQTAPVTPEAGTALDAALNAQAQTMGSVSTGAIATSGSNNPTNTDGAAAINKVSTDTPPGYSTIDFIRTYALNKSTPQHNSELPSLSHLHHHHHPHEAEELRITRHSKCVRKAYSISE
ncbi:uncharacterized protein LOC115625840 [Scaptodrosophila lebanonensis]|uniref:Uncharacterized protein LOC115625840 n=1 Tax=Drosophila lebanonensis TaxID=7225 RepID=A0A6J2TP59_DROLE|nr:uncharacterized protein LOC115625840 [Scaptodrosophila lebanonensis]